MKLGHQIRVRGYPVDQRALDQAEGTGAQARGQQVRDGYHAGWGDHQVTGDWGIKGEVTGLEVSGAQLRGHQVRGD